MSPRDRESTQYARLISARRARRRHVGYQTLINEVLAQHVRTDVAWTRGKPQLHRSEIAHSYGVYGE
jgi:hypothetical protein